MIAPHDRPLTTPPHDADATAPPRWITTSWDDGHPSDRRVAELLTAHGLTGTFYVPRQWDRPTMGDAELAALADEGFELGGHTVNHRVLTEMGGRAARREIIDCRAWLSDVTGRDCTVFCPPCGRFEPQDVALIREAGYLGFRTVEGWSLDGPRDRAGADGTPLFEMPTTLQAQPQPRAGHLRNITKRRSGANLWQYVRHGRGATWLDHAAALLETWAATGGVFHLWGHSWELDEFAQWERLDRVLGLMSRYRAHAATNGAICAAAADHQTTARPTARRAAAAAPGTPAGAAT